MGTKTGHVMTLSNSIIGVGILAMPFCFQKCGIILSIFLLIFSNFITRISCYYLVKSSLLCRRRSFEIMAFHVFGSQGKLLVELSIIGFLMGTCVTYFVVLGDLGPQMASKMFGFENNDILRSWTMVLVTIFCVIPMGLLRNVDSLSTVCTASIGFYCCLVIKIMTESRNQFSQGDWINHIEYWKVSGVLQCLPIISMALFCQLQLFEVFETVQNVSLEKLYSIVKTATSICTGVYILVGFFGYIAYCTKEFSGNILLNFPSSFTNDVIKIGFVLSVAFSFPLVIFPCRASVYSLLYRRGHADVAHYIPEHRFRIITVALVVTGLIIGIMIPSVELVIGLVGSTIGVAICVIFPASCFINISKKETTERVLAQALLVFGIILMILGTYANLAAIDEKTSGAAIEHYDTAVSHTASRRNLSDSAGLTKDSITAKVIPPDKVVYVKEINLLDAKIPATVKYELDANTKLLLIPSKINVPDVHKDELVKIVAVTMENLDPKIDRDLNREALRHEDQEIAIEAKAKPNDKLDETKELLKAQVDEIKVEIEKRNEETQKLVLEKFERIVETIGQNQDAAVKPVVEMPKKLIEAPAKPIEAKKEDKENNLLNRVNKIADRIDDQMEKLEIVTAKQIDKLTVQMAQLHDKTEAKLKNVEVVPAKNSHELLMEQVDKFAERVDKIHKVQQTEEQLLNAKKQTVPVDHIITPTGVPVSPLAGANQPVIVLYDKTLVKEIAKDGDDRKAHEILLQKVEKIVEKVERIEQHQEQEMKIKKILDDDTLVLQKIEAIGEKLDKFEKQQKEKLIEPSPTIVNDKEPVAHVEPKHVPEIPKNPVVELIINKTKPSNGIESYRQGKLFAANETKNVPPIPLLIRTDLTAANINNHPAGQPLETLPKSPNQLAAVEQKPNIEPKIEAPIVPPMPVLPHQHQLNAGDDENIKAIRRDLLTINTSDDKRTIAINETAKQPIGNLAIDTVPQTRQKREIGDTMNDCNNQQTADDTLLCPEVFELNAEKMILTEFDVKMIGRDLKAIDDNNVTIN